MTEYKNDTLTTSWQKYFYKRSPLNDDEDKDYECMALCHYDGGQCSIFVKIGDFCYFGRWGVDSDLFTLTPQGETLYFKDPGQ